MLRNNQNNLLFLSTWVEENEAGGMPMYEDDAFGDWLTNSMDSMFAPDCWDYDQYPVTLAVEHAKLRSAFNGKGDTLPFHMRQTLPIATSHLDPSSVSRQP